MEDTLHYTFSTIPQVLAAIIALLGVFWVFKISDLNNKLKSHAEVLKREVDPNDQDNFQYTGNLSKALMKLNYNRADAENLTIPIATSIKQENFKWIYTAICDINKVGKEEKKEIIASVKKKYEDIDNEKSELTANSKLVFILSGIQIVLSVSFLILVPVIESICYLPYLVLIPNLIFFFVIILKTVWTILSAIKITNYIK